jgi:pyruvate dehydrogenase E1 component alpha subunit
MKNTQISDRAASYGFRGETLDGNDVLAVYEATRRATQECRSGQGPVLLELLTYRRTGHSRRDPCHYQAKDEKEEWFRRDPIERFAKVLVDQYDFDSAELTAIKTKIDAEITTAIERAQKAPHPTLADLLTDVMA